MSKRILVLTQFYSPEPCAAANRAGSIVAGFQAQGHFVHVLAAAPSFPSGFVLRGYGHKSVECEGRVWIERVWTYASPRLRAPARLLNWMSVALSMTLAILRSRETYDVIYVSTPPITLALPALIAKWRFGAALIADVRDVFPEVAIRMGAWRKDSWISRAVGAVADALYARADHIVTVTSGTKSEIAARGVPENKIILAPNGFDAVVPALEPAYTPAAAEFVVAYVGNMGLATGLDVVLDTAKILAGDAHFRFLLMGGGADANRLLQRIRDESLSNVSYLGVLPRSAAVKTLQYANVCVVPLKKGIIDSLPTKMFDALATGCPIVVAAQGEASAFVERSGGGLSVPPEDPQALADALRRCCADREFLARCAQRGRAYVREHYDRTQIFKALAGRVSLLAAVD